MYCYLYIEVFHFLCSRCNIILCLISVFTCLLLLYRNTVDFAFCGQSKLMCQFQECLQIHQDLLSMQKIRPSSNRDHFIPLFSHCMPYIYSPYCADCSSSTALSKSDESKHSFPMSDLSGKAFRVSPLSVMLYVDFLQIFFTDLRKCPSIPRLLRGLLFFFKIMNGY